jgi:DNA primase
LSKKGKDFFGLCPFHREKSPSFSVNDEKNFYHCFGCGEHGSTIDFVQKTQNLSFVEAVKALAEEYHIRIEPATAAAKEVLTQREKISKINELTSAWFTEKLYARENVDVLEYLKRRGFSDEQINTFGLGYAPNDSRELTERLYSAGFTQAELVDAGLMIDKDGKSYCRFRRRIMFPIITREGIIAFGGRVTSSGDEPKYLNSPETAIFKKRSTFYLEHKAFSKARAANSVFVVEGYTDAISMHSIGLENTVATLGTAVSVEHIEKLWHIASVPTICMDGDQSGIAAMHRVISLALPLLQPGRSLAFVRLPDGSDPDSLIKVHGGLYFHNIIKNKIDLSDLVWNVYSSKINTRTPENKAFLKKTLIEVSETIVHPEVKRFYRSYLLRKFGELVYKRHTSPLLQVQLSSSKPLHKMSTVNRCEMTLAAALIMRPAMMHNADVFDKLHSITPKTKLLDQVYRVIVSTFSELGECDLNPQEFQARVKSKVPEPFFEYLCGKSSYFIDTVDIKDEDEAVASWLYTFDRYILELLKDEYRLAMRSLTDKSFEVASRLKLEIEQKEKAIKALHS